MACAGKMKELANSVVTKITLLIIGIVFPMNILLIVVTKNSIDTITSQTITANENMLNNYQMQIDKDMEAIDRFLYSMTKDGTHFLRLTQAKGEDEKKLTRYNLNNEFGNLLYLYDRAGGVFCVKEEEILLHVRSSLLMEEEVLQSYLAAAEHLETARQWTILQIGDRQYLVHVFKQNNAYVGALIFVEYVVGELEALIEYRDKQVYLMPEQAACQKDTELGIYSSSRLNQTGICFSVILKRSEILENLPMLQKLNYYLAIVLLFSVPLLLVMLYKILIQPLQRINRALDSIQDESMDYRIRACKTSAEFDHINQAFNLMMNRIVYLKIQNYEQMMEKHQVETTNMLLQVRPHFLLNAFHLIYNLAQMEDYVGVQKMAACLTTYYREGVREKVDFRTVGAEMAFVENYLEIARMRYPDCFEVEEQIEDSVREKNIPVMLIYTFVENAISHLVSFGSFLTIRIQVIWRNGKIWIEVCDDGEGIPEDILEQINRGDVIVKNGEQHIGYWTCRKRLAMLYGKEAVLAVESVRSQGTRVRIELPNQTEYADTGGHV